MNSHALASGASRQPVRPYAGLVFLLPFTVFVVHTLEELPGFAAW